MGRTYSTKSAVAMIEQYHQMVLHFNMILRIRNTINPENWTSTVRECDEKYIAVYMQGAMNMLDAHLSEQNCYRGFSYVNSNETILQGIVLTGKPVTEDPEYREWRRSYYYAAK